VNNDLKMKQPNFSIVVSILIALVLWIYVIGEVDPNVKQHFNNIPVKINNLQILEENGLVLAGDQEKEYTVDISLYGRMRSFFGLRNLVTASINITDITSKGTYDIEVNIDGIPDDIEIKNISPKEISLKVDRLSNADRNVELNIQGEPKDGLNILDYTTKPNKVNISGSEEIIKSVNKIVGDINIKDASNDVSKSVELYAVDKNNKKIEYITINTNTTNVKVNIGKTKTIAITPELSGTPMVGYMMSQVVVEPKEITVGAKNNLLDNIEAIPTKLISIDKINADFETNVEVILPNAVKIINGKSTVLVKVSVEKIETREYNLSKVELFNKPENVEITLPQENNVTVELEGKKDDLDNLTQEKIKLLIDVKDTKVGENDIDIKMEDIKGLTLKSIKPKTLTVTATEK